MKFEHFFDNTRLAPVIFIFMSMLFISRCSAPPRTQFNEPYRPQFHFTPEKNWMNDPNGMVYYDGEYHLFYQHNPFGPKWGHMSWGHAVSNDLVHWEHLPVALYEEDGVMIFSGSAVVDHNNTSGFGSVGNPPMVAIYTGHTEENQSQHIAYSTDRGRTWTKYANNPVIDLGMKDFRDPKVFWHEDTGKWIMVVALPREYKLHFYGSDNLIDWDFLSEFGPAGATTGIWECPDLFELPIEGGNGATRWLLDVNIGSGAAAGGSGGQYFIGTFDGVEFVNDNPDDQIMWIDYGADYYAAVSWADIPEEDGRRILLGWMNNWQYANDIPTDPWRSAQSLPRTLSLRETPQGLRLVQRAVTELEQLRQTSPVTLSNLDVSDEIILEGIDDELIELHATFDVKDASELGFTFHHSEGQKTVVGYNVSEQRIYIDRTNAGNVDFHQDFSGVHGAPLALENGRLEMKVWLDRSSIEVLAGDGLVAITDRIFPTIANPHVSVWSSGGNAVAEQITVWPLASIYD